MQFEKINFISQQETTMAFHFGGSATLNASLNYIFGCLMIVFFLISTILNPLLFYSYTKKQQTIQNFLFKVIAVSDFLTNVAPTIFMAYVFLSDMVFRHTLVNQLPEFFSCTFGCISQVTTSMMAVTRMISVIKPFFRVKFRWVIAYLIFYAIYMSIGNGGSLVILGIDEKSEGSSDDSHHDHGQDHHGNHIDLRRATLETINKFVCFVMNVIHCILGIVCSFITVIHLRFNTFRNAERDRKLKSCNTILIMNIPYVISVVTNILAYYDFLGVDFQMVNHYFIPIMTSAFNPCVIVIRTDAFRVAMQASGVNSAYIGCSTTRTSFVNNKQNGQSDVKAPMVMFENPSIVQEDDDEEEREVRNNPYDHIELVEKDSLQGRSTEHSDLEKDLQTMSGLQDDQIKKHDTVNR